MNTRANPRTYSRPRNQTTHRILRSTSNTRISRPVNSFRKVTGLEGIRAFLAQEVEEVVFFEKDSRLAAHIGPQDITLTRTIEEITAIALATQDETTDKTFIAFRQSL